MSSLNLATEPVVCAGAHFGAAVQQRNLARFVATEESQQSDRLTTSLSWTSALFFLALGLVLMTAPVPALDTVGNAVRRQVRLRLDTVEAPQVAPPVEPIESKPEPAEIPRLEPETILAAPVDRPAITPEATKAPAPQATETPVEAPARRVYGVRRVYAKGLGSGAASGAGLVTKQGNALGGERDTLTATAADLQGELAALSTIDKAPEPRHRAKPEYSADMRQARAEGMVTAYLLVDTDGSVQDVRITADIGWDSAQVATEALRRFTFKPAIKNKQPVAVWIRHHIRFEFQE